MPSALSLRELFEAAIELAADERSAFLDQHCVIPQLRAHVERLLAADAGPDHLFAGGAPAAAAAIGDAEPALALPPGSLIGPFELVAVLGEGGSSTVFRARRDLAGVSQEVALKVLRRGLYTPDARRQFRREREALAQLRHPGIARLIEGGVTTDGLAYIALELVEGKPIIDFARERRLGLRERLALFLQVCAAVESAHRALIVHRDLKPSNVLVAGGPSRPSMASGALGPLPGDGQVKLLDFGIAKLLDSDEETRTGVPTFTPAYAAPEQREGGLITTATDVYALGILLGELVTGQRLGAGSGRTPSSQISEGQAPGVLPAPAPVTRRALRGDLDNIVLKAIEAEPERRYASAGALADDVARMLAGRPVSAHPPSRLYRARKFMGRHRGGVAASATFVLGLLAALGLALREGSIARHEASRANAMRDFMFSAFSEAEPGAPRDGPPRITDVIAEAIAKARGDARMNPQVRAELLTELGAVLRARGRVADAQRALQWNYDQARRDFGDGDPLTLAAGRELARCLMLSGDYGGSRQLVDALIARVPTDETALHSELLLDSAELATKQHDEDRAARDGGAGMRLARAGGDEDQIAYALSTMGNVQLSANDLAGAARTYRELQARYARRYGEQHAKVTTVHAALSRVLRRLGDLSGAEREIRAALAIDAGVLPKDDWRHANHLNALTMVLRAKRDFPAALEAAREGLRINRIAFGDEHPEVANDLSNIGTIQLRMENYADAVAPLREALDLAVARFGAGRYETAGWRADYGFALAHAGDWTAGEAELRRAIDLLEHAQKPQANEIAAACEKLVRVELDRGAAREALPLLDRIDALLAAMPAPDAYWIGRNWLLRGATLVALHDPQHALPPLRAADSALSRSTDPDPQLRVETALLLAEAAQATGDEANAKASFEQGSAQLAALKDAPPSLQRLADDVRSKLTIR